MTFPPWSLYILTGFALVDGWLLHRAALVRVYRITGVRFLDAYVLAWLLGVLCGYTPAFLYLAFGFNEFADTPEGKLHLQRVHWAGRAETIFLVLYGLVILLTVRQPPSQPVTPQEMEQVIVWNVAFALVAILFTVIADLLRKLR